MTVTLPARPRRPTMYFVGVSTGESFINKLFPRWAKPLGLGSAALVGIDLPLNAPAADYGAVLRFLHEQDHARGALVTSHKVNIVQHGRDLIDELGPHAERLGEVSCLIREGTKLVGRALDPTTSGLALADLASDGYWSARGQAGAMVLGAGGAGMALALHLLERPADDRPARIVLTDVDGKALAHARGALGSADPDGRLELRRVERAADHDQLLTTMADGSLVANATGMGKDTPGSPLGFGALLPVGGLVWEFNYRGERPFLDTAYEQQEARGLIVADGWRYFLHGWSQAIAQVFDVTLKRGQFDKLMAAADKLREA